MRWNLSDRLQLNRLSLSASYSPDTALPTSERVHLRARLPALRLAGRGDVQRRGLLRPVRPDQDRPQGLQRARRAEVTLVYDEPRRLELDVEGASSGNLDRLPDYQNVPVDVDDLVTVDGDAALQRRSQLAWQCRR